MDCRDILLPKEKDVTSSRWIAIVGLAVVFFPLPLAHAESDPNTKIADRFDVKFAWPEGSGLVQLHCEVEVLDPNLVLGMSRKGVIAKLEDDKGEIIEVVDHKSPLQTVLVSRYETPRYRTLIVYQPKMPKWKRAIRRLLRLPRPPAQSIIPMPSSSKPQVIRKTERRRMTLELDSGLLGPESEMISRVEGHFYVLMAESFKHVEVPFEPNKKWVRLTPDLEIRVIEAQSTTSNCRYRMETRQGEGAFKGSFSSGSNLPGQFVAGYQLLGPNDKPNHRGIWSLLPQSATAESVTGRIGRPVKKICFAIAVKPRHHKIPFELENISLPKR